MATKDAADRAAEKIVDEIGKHLGAVSQLLITEFAKVTVKIEYFKPEHIAAIIRQCYGEDGK